MHFLIQTKSGSGAWNRLSTVSKLNQVISQRVLTVAKSKNGIDGWEIDRELTFSPDPVNYPEEIYGIEDHV